MWPPKLDWIEQRQKSFWQARKAWLRSRPKKRSAVGWVFSGVPYFVLNGRVSVSGAQPPDIFVSAIQQTEKKSSRPWKNTALDSYGYFLLRVDLYIAAGVFKKTVQQGRKRSKEHR